MCYAKPGLRCSNHLSAEIARKKADPKTSAAEVAMLEKAFDETYAGVKATRVRAWEAEQAGNLAEAARLHTYAEQCQQQRALALETYKASRGIPSAAQRDTTRNMPRAAKRSAALTGTELIGLKAERDQLNAGCPDKEKTLSDLVREKLTLPLADLTFLSDDQYDDALNRLREKDLKEKADRAEKMKKRREGTLPPAEDDYRRGRQQTVEGENRKMRVGAMLTSDEEARLKKLAAAMGITTSDLVRCLILDKPLNDFARHQSVASNKARLDKTAAFRREMDAFEIELWANRGQS